MRWKKTGVDADTLRALRTTLLAAGKDVPPLLDARLAFSEAEGLARYVRMMVSEQRVFPRMLPTQATGRWSTADPPLVNFPRKMADGKTNFPMLIMPDLGTYWIKFDWSAIEARLAAAYAGDAEDLAIFNKGHDIHTYTACLIYGHPVPPNLANPHTDPACEAWRQQWSPPWTGSKDLRRTIAKNSRYASTYTFDASGKAILGQKDIEKSGIDRDALVEAARRYIASKRVQWAYKQKVREQCLRTGVAYTFLGGRRRLFGSDSDKAKLGWNSMVQGAVADMMNSTLIEIAQRYPSSRLIVNRHDGAEIEFPAALPLQEAYPNIKEIVERIWHVNGHPIQSVADWQWVDDRGHEHSMAA